MAAKLVVTSSRGGSRIALVGVSGTELLTSKVFTEPRAKGATLRSLKGLLGEDIVVEDHTLTATRKPAAAAASGKPVAAAAAAARGTATTVKASVRSAAKTAGRTAGKAKRTAARAAK